MARWLGGPEFLTNADLLPADADDREPLASCVCGEHFDCPDGWHWDDAEQPCGCTAPCAAGEACRVTGRPVDDCGCQAHRPEGTHGRGDL